MSAAVDPFVITSRERAKYVEHFKSLKPVNEIVTGQQARGFFLQSQLPPAVLSEIWNLADTDRDGKMNINEFSIARKLVNLKLRNFELPKQLPPTMIASLTSFGTTPTLTPTGAGSLSPVTSIPAGVEEIEKLNERVVNFVSLKVITVPIDVVAKRLFAIYKRSFTLPRIDKEERLHLS